MLGPHATNSRARATRFEALHRRSRSQRGHGGVIRRPPEGIAADTGHGGASVFLVATRRKTGGRPRRVNQDVLDQMRRLRRSGYTLREIAEKVERSERTVRRYVKDVEPDVRVRPDFGTNQLMVWFSEKILEYRRSLIAYMQEEWDEVLELGVEAVDEATTELRKRLEAMDKITIKRMMTDDTEFRQEYFEEFMTPVLRNWASNLNFLRNVRQLREAAGPSGWLEDDDHDEEHEVSDRAR